ncbi:ABC transporter permease subunit [Rossellomorea vietnamensis]|uniref:ABC transporter permease subunit n=1 Tax=Rossellomorea vietnamensis TaxID=218284 RepID=A0A5D4P1B5_9BACI|nr:ABC transporter permease subunit [Rossellomorea vietnamensis]TYS19859.1 ABC transporter permease subunit [Rossellomorea vietnamensis]
MTKRLIRNPLFMIGFLFIASLILLSLYHYIFMDNEIPQHGVLYNSEGKALEAPPFSPSEKFWFGTDRTGDDLFYKIIAGAKYTLGIAFGLGVVRILLSIMFGYLLYNMSPFIKTVVQSGTEPFRYIPATLLGFFILLPVSVSTVFTVTEKTVIQLLVIVMIGVPMLSQVFKDEFIEISFKEYVSAAKIMGASPMHIFRKQMLPIVKPRIPILFIQQVVQVLILLAHLGLLKIFIGGADFAELYSGEPKYALSTSNEWSGLIGSYFYQLPISPWLLVFPVVFFSLSILSLNFILEGLKESRDKIGKGEVERKEVNPPKKALEKSDFTFAQKI